ncbi:MAG: lactoylglutathione lyase-like lyase [Microbacteriaceae bacterium]|nr:lactoylglutathione lyase-like lyase [Microbacteriaceae bacterium]
MSTQFSHLAISVSDLERSADFYAEVFGCRAGSIYRGSGPEVSRLMEVKDADFRGIFLSTGTTFLELLEYGTNTADDAIREPDSLGYAHISFLVDDLDEILLEVVAHGGTVRESIEIPFGHQADTRMAFVGDPDGNRVELVCHPNSASTAAHSRFLGLDGLGWPSKVAR